MIHPTTLIKIRFEEDEKIIQVSDLQLNKKRLDIFSPDGWVEISEFIDMKMVKAYTIYTDNGFSLQTDYKQSFKSNFGWIPANEIVILNLKGPIHINTVKKMSKAIASPNESNIPVVGIVVNHPNHRFWAAGVEVLDDSDTGSR